MRFRFDRDKSRRLRENRKRGIGFDEAQEIFSHPYYEDRRSDYPEQYRAIGWVSGQLYSLIYEVRQDAGGAYYHLVTLWRATKEDMKSAVDRPTADEIAEMADSGRVISRFFTNQGTMKQPLTSISVEVTQEMLQELDQMAAALRISRQEAINSCLRKALDQHLPAERGER